MGTLNPINLEVTQHLVNLASSAETRWEGEATVATIRVNGIDELNHATIRIHVVRQSGGDGWCVCSYSPNSLVNEDGADRLNAMLHTINEAMNNIAWAQT